MSDEEWLENRLAGVAAFSICVAQLLVRALRGVVDPNDIADQAMHIATNMPPGSHADLRNALGAFANELRKVDEPPAAGLH